MQTNINSVDCETCEFAKTKQCKKCIEDNTLISITELKAMLKKTTDTKEYREKITRSFGDCGPDYQEIKFEYVDSYELNKLINKLTKQ